MAEDRNKKANFGTLKNTELLGGKKESIQEILDKGPQKNTTGKDFDQYYKNLTEKISNKQGLNIEGKVAEREKQLEEQKDLPREKEQNKNIEQEKNKEIDKDK